jgi:GTPase SAR1 family protein
VIERGQFDPLKAFALTEFPFDPVDIPGIDNPLLIPDSLMKEPLPIHKEEKLMRLYCSEIATFADNEAKFMRLMRMGGYSFERPRVGRRQYIFFVRGSVGTGKSTLVNVMRHWLDEMKMPTDPPKWHFFEAWDIGDDTLTSDDQIKKLQDLEQQIGEETKEGDYCCIVADNIVEGVEQMALKLFKRLRNRNKIFLFLETNRLELINKRWDNTSYRIELFDTVELTPADAVQYVRHRVNYFRVAELTSNLGEHELFPFAEDKIRQAVRARHSMEGGDPERGETITIRQLNEILNAAMLERMDQLESSFDIATVPKDEIGNHIIDVRDYYRGRMAS